MKKDKLEQFVRKNAGGFDSLEPPQMAWDTIERELRADKKTTFKLWSVVWKAAAAVLIFASAWLLKDYTDHKKHSGHEINSAQAAGNPQLGELSDAEAYYTTQINSRQAELAVYARQHPEIIEDLKQEFREMDKNKAELKRDLAESNADEKVVEAIILSYRVKLEILEQMLIELRKAKEPAPKPVETNL